MTTLTILTTEIRQFDGLYSLNDLHKAAGGHERHKPSNFLRLDTTQELIEEISCSDLSIIPAKTVTGKGKQQGTMFAVNSSLPMVCGSAPSLILQLSGHTMRYSRFTQPLCPNSSRQRSKMPCNNWRRARLVSPAASARIFGAGSIIISSLAVISNCPQRSLRKPFRIYPICR